MGIATDAIHAGQEPEPVTGAVTVPIYQTSTYAQRTVDPEPAFDYARTVNPTRTALERCLATLEGGKYGLCFASGMAAVDALLRVCSQGDEVLVTANVYGGTQRLFQRVLADFGLTFTFLDTSNLALVEEHLARRPRLLFVETPSNPMMILSDVRALADRARAAGTLFAVDNTFMSPALQRPLDLGADVVVHSTTKYLNGHSDSVGGVVITNQAAVADRLKFVQNAAGAILSPFDSFLTLRGVKTLAVRMRQHDASGRAVAEFLVQHPKVGKVLYPGLPDHPQHALAQAQASGFGGMVTFELADQATAVRFLEALRLCVLGESLGGVETLVCHPAVMTHASVPEADRARLGLTGGLVRISVGIEDLEDLIADLDQALAAV